MRIQFACITMLERLRTMVPSLRKCSSRQDKAETYYVKAAAESNGSTPVVHRTQREVANPTPTPTPTAPRCLSNEFAHTQMIVACIPET